MITLIAEFETLDRAQTARQQLLKAGYAEASVRVPDPSFPSQTATAESPRVDGSAIGSALGTGIELGMIAAIPFVGPLLALGPLEHAAEKSQDRLAPAFTDSPHPESIRMTVVTDQPDKARRDLRRLGARIAD